MGNAMVYSFILSMVYVLYVVSVTKADVFKPGTLSGSSLSSASEDPYSMCYDTMEGIWYLHGTQKDGLKCGGCACVNGDWYCSSCSDGILTCPRINCNISCGGDDYIIKKNTHGCRECQCIPSEYCLDYCMYCLQSPMLPCPDVCNC